MKIKKGMIEIEIIEYLLQLIYPNVCGICEQINKNSLCEKCKLELDKKIIGKIHNYTNNVSKIFNKHYYIFKYDGQIRKLLIDYKFNNKAYLYKTFSQIILNNTNIINFIKNYDIIIPVPIHKKRFNTRGYNQSELLAKEISKKLKDVDFRNDVLIKIKDNTAQSTLNKKERILNVKGAYRIKNEKFIKEKTVLLIDDIYTTGNTVNECSKVLMENGAKEIGIFTISKD